MFGIGSTELLVILVVALIALGPKSLASVSRSLGKAMGEFRRVSTDFQRTLNAESAQADIRQKAAEQQNKRTDERASESSTPSGTAAPGETAAPWEAAPQGDSPAAPKASPLEEALARARAEAEEFAADSQAANASSSPPVDKPRA